MGKYEWCRAVYGAQLWDKNERCLAPETDTNAIYELAYISAIIMVSAVDSLEGPLLQVEGLSDLRLELHSKKMNMHSVLIDELHRHLYIKSTSRVGQWNQDKNRSGPLLMHPIILFALAAAAWHWLLQEAADDERLLFPSAVPADLRSLPKDSPLPVLDVTNLSTPRKFLDTSQFGSPGCSTVKDLSLQEIKEDPDSDPEESSIVFMGVLIKGLAKLKKIPETVKAIKERLENELKQIVKRSTTQVADSGYQRGETVTQENQPRLLLELLELLFDKFNAVASAHSVVLGYLQETVASPTSQDGDTKLYDMAEVWVKIQTVIQEKIMDYPSNENLFTTQFK
ncbi:unnamed protein product, partial [Ranitomeya imitator]